MFAGLFFLTQYPYPEKIPVDLFLRLDPLVMVVSMIAARAFIVSMSVAVVVILLSALLGRFFCGYVCPLGAMIDFSHFLFFNHHHKPEKPGPKPNRTVKYFILVAVIVASLLGANVLHMFSPMSIAPRVMTFIFYPPFIWMSNFIIDLIRPLMTAMGFYTFTQLSLSGLYFDGIFAILLLFIFIIGANYWRKRFWCRYVCPTGAFLSLFSRFGIVKRKVDERTCNRCQRCCRVCDMHAIDIDPSKTILGECTLCGDCVDACPKKGVSIGISNIGFSGNNAALNIERRKALYSVAAGLVTASSLKLGINSPKNITGNLIRPPGAVPEQQFLSRCIRCGECMKVCKTNGLQPSNMVSGIDRLWTPRLVPRRGACEEKCTMCGQVCPTQAIRSLPVEEKVFTKIGTAVIDRNRCIAWEQDKLCLICDEICPYDAIEFRIVDNFTGPFKRPFVIEDKCTGCGWCEHKCPVSGRGAVEVFSIGEERKAKGTYITRQKKELRQIKENHETLYEGDVLGSGGENLKLQKSSPLIEKSKQENQNSHDEELPGGFITD